MTRSSFDPGQQAESGRQILSSHVETLISLLSSLDLQAIEHVAELLDQVCVEGKTVYCAGNGGSAATASHIVTDLTWGRRMNDASRPRAISLAANAPLMTALANDVGYADVFVEQLKSGFNQGDALIAISASGNSENVLRAVDFANSNGGRSVGLTGFDGGKLKDACHLSVHVPTALGSYELVEDVHHSVCHMLSSYLKFKAARRSDGRLHGAG